MQQVEHITVIDFMSLSSIKQLYYYIRKIYKCMAFKLKLF